MGMDRLPKLDKSRPKEDTSDRFRSLLKTYLQRVGHHYLLDPSVQKAVKQLQKNLHNRA